MGGTAPQHAAHGTHASLGCVHSGAGGRRCDLLQDVRIKPLPPVLTPSAKVVVGAEYRGVRQTFCATVRVSPSTWPSSWDLPDHTEASPPHHIHPATRKTSGPQHQGYDDQLTQTTPPRPPRPSGCWSWGLVSCGGRAAQDPPRAQMPKATQTLCLHPRKSITKRTGRGP